MWYPYNIYILFDCNLEMFVPFQFVSFYSSAQVYKLAFHCPCAKYIESVNSLRHDEVPMFFNPPQRSRSQNKIASQKQTIKLQNVVRRSISQDFRSMLLSASQIDKNTSEGKIVKLLIISCNLFHRGIIFSLTTTFQHSTQISKKQLLPARFT